MTIRLRYSADANYIHRCCETQQGAHHSRIKKVKGVRRGAFLAEAWLVAYLRGSPVEDEQPLRRALTVIDAFSGCGGFALGVRDGLQAAGFQTDILAAIDVDPAALSIYQSNLKPRFALLGNANSLVDFQIKGGGPTAAFQYQPEILEPKLAEIARNVDAFIAGPPCQGHSNLNNITRRSDPRNLLYVTAASLGIALRPSIIVIENVPQVVRAYRGVVETAKALLRSSGYVPSELTIDASMHSCAQTRRRHFLFAHKLGCGAKQGLVLESVSRSIRVNKFPVSSVIGDLLKVTPGDFMDEPSILSDENIDRIRYLFENDLYELPDKNRPLCHRNGHTYPSVYGRMKWDEPAQTVTSGFLSPGRGRFIHPRLARTLTLHEGARIQSFPDSFRFAVQDKPTISRTDISRMIADAVPPSLGAVLGIAMAAVTSELAECDARAVSTTRRT